MSLDYVKKGESVKASTLNSIIDAIGGNQRMSPDLNVTTTTRGPQVSLPSNYGGPNNKPDKLLDVGRYQLSGWPMVKLQLGFKLDDCLGAIKYHRADGTTSTSVSAAVVYQNSENCPTGSDLSGYIIESSDFGKDAVAHSAGWVDTLIEDPYPGGFLEAQLWKYKSGSELAEVFTNVDDQKSVQQQLSSILYTNGVSEDDLDTLDIVGQWKLLDSAILSVKGQDTLVPTHEIVLKNGTIDCYEIGSFDYNVVLKASLECIDVQKDNNGELSATWAWKIPLGSDANYFEGKAHSNSVTYGGNEVIFEVEERDIGSDFNGEATYNGKAIWYGSYKAKAGEELFADEVWLNLSYDYQIKATKGIFSSSKGSGSYTQDGILNRNVFVAKLSSFKIGAEVAKGDKAPAESIEYGTWGVLPKDGPKLDTYCQKDSYTYFKSLDWANREGGTVECQCAELYGFDKLQTVDPLSTDNLVIRRIDENKGAEVKYISLSALEISGMYVPPDADVPVAQTSSLQTRELDDGSKVEEMFQFHVPDTVDVHISDLMSVDVVLRNPNNGQPYIEYGKLCIDIAPDAQGQTGQKSIDWLNGTNELQLYKFDEVGLSAFKPDITANGKREHLLPEEYEFVLRKNGAGGEITYGNVDLSINIEKLSGDSQVIQQKSISVDNNYIELYHMEFDGQELSSEVPTHFDEPKSILSDDCEFVIRKGGAGGEIDYTTVKLRQAKLSVDSDTIGQKSIQYNPTSNELQLYKMHQNGEAGHNVTITSAMNSLLPSNYELVVRKGGAGGQIEYTKLSAAVRGTVELDTQVLPQQKSLEWKIQNNIQYAQLYKMDADGEPTEHVDLKFAKNSYQDLLPDDEEFVIRTKAGGLIEYKNVGVCLSAYLSSLSSTTVEVDSEVIGTRKSLDLIISQNLDPYYQLHNFQTSAVNGPDTLIKFQDQPSPGEDFSIGCNTEFVVRVPDGNDGYEVKYMQLSAYQEHERVDSRQQNTRGYSLEYTPYYAGTQYDVLQLYGFEAGCSYFITSADISSVYGNGILIRKWNEQGCCWQLDYMNFNSLDELAVKYIGDSQLSLSAHNPYSKSTTVLWDEYDQKKYIELYGFKSDFEFETVTIHNDGCTYYWPQGIRTDKQLDEFDYTLVKHVDSNGNISLRYTQLQVQMPDINSLEVDINNIYTEINDIHIDIQYLSGYIDILSGELSATGWESGGDSSTCYGSNIGDHDGDVVIDLDKTTLSGSWKTTQDFTTEGNHRVGANLSVDYDGYVGGCLNVGGYSYAGCGFQTGNTYFTRVGAYVEGPVTIANDFAFNVGCAYLNQSTLQVGCNIRIGNTTLTESQLSSLLALI